MLIKTLCFGMTLALPATLSAQAPANSLTPEQQQRFQAAQQEFQAKDFTKALADMRSLLAESPDNRSLALGTAETALEAGQAPAALDLLKAYEAKHPDDWSPLTYETRAYAETGQEEKRDALLARLIALRKTSSDPQLQKLAQFLVERVRTDKGHVDIFYSLKPYSAYNTAETAYVFNAEGQRYYRVTLESSDLDQATWAKEHPDLAAKGMRVFTIDGYSSLVSNGNNTGTYTHSTYAFLDGQPTYNVFRQRALAIVAGQANPMSSSKIVVDTRPKAQ
jgi:hypothetical protein